MLKVKEIMTKNVISISSNTEIIQAAKILLEKGFNGLPVLDNDNKLIGILCQSDLITQQKEMPIPSLFSILDGFIPFSSMKQVEKEVQKIVATTVSEAMTRDPVSVGPEDSIESVATLIVNKHFHSVPVIDNGKLIGIIGKLDILKTLIS